MRRILILASSVLFVPAVALAQHHGGGGMGGGGMIGMGHVAAPAVGHVAAPVAHTNAMPAQAGGARMAAAPHIMPAAGAAAGATMVRRTHVGTPVNRNGNVVFSSFPNVPVFANDVGNTPGLGFDFAHLAAINSGRVRHRRFGFGGGDGFGFGGGFLFPSSVIVEEAQPEVQQVVPEEAVANTGENERPHRSDMPYYSASSEPPAPQHDAPEYVFVRRDGGLVFAVAYSWDKGMLRYITRDGMRGSVTQGALDLDATQQFNEQRGVNFRAPV